jgi:hypothetical protein
MTELKHFKQAQKDLLKAEQLAEEINRLALLLGATPAGLNTTNAQRSVAKAVEELVAAREQAEELGYSSLARALMALGQKKPELRLPDWARIAPAHWVVETGVQKVEHWKNGNIITTHYKVKEVTGIQAQRQLDRLKPYLSEVLESLNWEPAEVENVKEAFLTQSHREFEDGLLNFLRGDTSEEQVEETNQVDPELEAKLEELRTTSQELGEEFDEEATRALLTKV